MKRRLDVLRDRLRRDGLERRAFVLMAYATIWLEPNWSYREILEAYSDYVGDAPERVHADLCRRLLAAGKEIGPEKYLEGVRKEVERENRILTEQGSGAGALCADT